MAPLPALPVLSTVMLTVADDVSADGNSLPVPIFVIGIAISAVLWALFFVWFMRRRKEVLFPAEADPAKTTLVAGPEDTEPTSPGPTAREIRIPEQYQ